MSIDRDPAASPPETPGRRMWGFWAVHPALALFAVLGPAMVAILLLAMQSVAMEPSQRLAMALATLGLAAACAWIISLK
ncbi:MAG: hypothetical protein EXR58_00345 [Chloroflexi bacterium]|nr:hypothetical protein [Chloroflexota bacterium]